MTMSRQPMDEAGRKRHLEALFADEPYLSPTMKARRMHEKVADARGRDVAFAERPAAPSRAGDLAHAPASLEDGADARGERFFPSGPRISLQEAKARLGGQGVPDPFAFSPSDPIFYFRT